MGSTIHFCSRAQAKIAHSKAVRRRNCMLSTQEQPNHPHQELPTGSAQYQEGQHQDPQSLSRAGRAWQQGLDPQRKQSTSSSNTFSYNNLCNMTSWGSSRSMRPTAAQHRGHLHQACRDRRSWSISTMLGSQPSTTSKHQHKQGFHRSMRASVCPCVHVRTRCVAYTYRHALFEPWCWQRSAKYPLYHNASSHRSSTC